MIERLNWTELNNEKVEKEIKETIPFTIAMKRIKHLGIYRPKETKDLYIENYKTLMKEIKEDTNRWETYTMFMDVKNQNSENEYLSLTENKMFYCFKPKHLQFIIVSD